MRHLIISIFICLLLTFTLFARDKGNLAKLQRIVKDTSYGNYWDRLNAITKLGKIQNQDSTLLLIELLGDKEPPIQEAAVMALTKMKDTDLIKWFAEQTLPRHNINKEIKANAAWALSFIKAEECLPYLIKALSDKHPDVSIRVMEAMAPLASANSYSDLVATKLKHRDSEVRTVAARTLGIMNAPNISKVLIKKLRDRAPEVRAALIEAIARTEKPDNSLPHLLKALKDKAPEVKIAALESLLNEEPEKTLNPAIELLNDKDWKVRASAVTVLRKLRQKDCFEPLILRLAKETGRLRYDIVQALQGLLGRSLGYNPKDWENWFLANKNNIQITEKGLKISDNSKQTLTIAVPRFFEIPVFGKNIIFIIDFSGSMKTEVKGENKRRIDIAQEQLAGALKKFTPKMRFNIILMSTEATRIKKRQGARGLLPATEQNKQKALDFVSDTWDYLENIKRGRGDMYDALLEAFAELEVDTIFLLSDGKPTYGQFIVSENILENLFRKNQYRKIMINTILTGGKGAAKRLMENIAELTGGIYIKK